MIYEILGMVAAGMVTRMSWHAGALARWHAGTLVPFSCASADCRSAEDYVSTCARRELSPGHKHGTLVCCRYTTCARGSK